MPEPYQSQIIHRSCFQTSDDKLFTSEKEAQQHQALIDAAEWYESHKLYGQYEGSYVQFDDLLEWLQANKDVVRTLL